MISYTNATVISWNPISSATDNWGASTAIHMEGWLQTSATTGTNHSTSWYDSQYRPLEISEEEALANRKAEELLVACLSPENGARFKNDLDIVIPSTIFPDVNYHIKSRRFAKINVVQGDRLIDSMCITPDAESKSLPNNDIILSKVLHLQFNEAESIRVANYADNLRAMLGEQQAAEVV